MSAPLVQRSMSRSELATLDGAALPEGAVLVIEPTAALVDVLPTGRRVLSWGEGVSLEAEPLTAELESLPIAPGSLAAILLGGPSTELASTVRAVRRYAAKRALVAALLPSRVAGLRGFARTLMSFGRAPEGPHTVRSVSEALFALHPTELTVRVLDDSTKSIWARAWL